MAFFHELENHVVFHETEPHPHDDHTELFFKSRENLGIYIQISKRDLMGKIVSGKAITEDNILVKMCSL